MSQHYSPLARSEWLYGISSIFCIFIVRSLWRSYIRASALPPGPRGVPILGNVFQLTPEMPWFKFEKWAKEFGPIMSVNIAGQRVIILNTYKAAADLLDRRSRLYSDRFRLILGGEILTGGIMLALMRNTPLYRRMRRVAHEGLNVRAVEKYKVLQIREAAFATQRIMDSPKLWPDHFQYLSAAIVLKAVYGWPSHEPIDKNNQWVKDIFSTNNYLSHAVAPGNSIVDIFPILNYLPLSLSKWKRVALDWYDQKTRMFAELNEDTMNRLRDGNDNCLVHEILEKKGYNELTKAEAAWLSGTMFMAGSETTAGTLVFFLQAMVLYPEVVKKAQAELDAVVGRERSPNFEDIQNLPYVQAIVKETLRWRPALPLSVPRMINEDDWYKGYLIPKGAMILPNVWEMNRDPEIFPDFDEFRPERHLSGMVVDDTHGFNHATFGFGRRICVGSTFATQTLHAMAATLLWACNIEAVLDSECKPMMPSKTDFVENGIVFGPRPFEANITERFLGARAILEKKSLNPSGN